MLYKLLINWVALDFSLNYFYSNFEITHNDIFYTKYVIANDSFNFLNFSSL